MHNSENTEFTHLGIEAQFLSTGVQAAEKYSLNQVRRHKVHKWTQMHWKVGVKVLSLYTFSCQTQAIYLLAVNFPGLFWARQTTDFVRLSGQTLFNEYIFDKLTHQVQKFSNTLVRKSTSIFKECFSKFECFYNFEEIQ